MRGVRGGWLPVLVGTIALVRFAAGVDLLEQDQPGPVGEPAVSPPTPQAIALLGGLAEGDELAGWKVERVEGPVDGSIRVWVVKEGVRWAAKIWRTGRSPGPPPRSTKKFDLTYGNVEPAEATVNQAETSAVLDALARRIMQTEDTVPMPAGL